MANWNSSELQTPDAIKKIGKMPKCNEQFRYIVENCQGWCGCS